MKKGILNSVGMSVVAVLATFLLSISSVAATQSSIEGRLNQAELLQYFHCVPKVKVKAAELLTHYLVDLSDSEKTVLMTANSTKKTLAKDILDWKVIDQNMNSNVVANGIDVQWTSVANDLDFQLIIKSTDGELMEGLLVSHSRSVPVRCLDVSIEKK